METGERCHIEIKIAIFFFLFLGPVPSEMWNSARSRLTVILVLCMSASWSNGDRQPRWRPRKNQCYGDALPRLQRTRIIDELKHRSMRNLTFCTERSDFLTFTVDSSYHPTSSSSLSCGSAHEQPCVSIQGALVAAKSVLKQRAQKSVTVCIALVPRPERNCSIDVGTPPLEFGLPPLHEAVILLAAFQDYHCDDARLLLARPPPSEQGKKKKKGAGSMLAFRSATILHRIHFVESPIRNSQSTPFKPVPAISLATSAHYGHVIYCRFSLLPTTTALSVWNFASNPASSLEIVLLHTTFKDQTPNATWRPEKSQLPNDTAVLKVAAKERNRRFKLSHFNLSIVNCSFVNTGRVSKIRREEIRPACAKTHGVLVELYRSDCPSIINILVENSTFQDCCGNSLLSLRHLKGKKLRPHDRHRSSVIIRNTAFLGNFVLTAPLFVRARVHYEDTLSLAVHQCIFAENATPGKSASLYFLVKSFKPPVGIPESNCSAVERSTLLVDRCTFSRNRLVARKTSSPLGNTERSDRSSAIRAHCMVDKPVDQVPCASATIRYTNMSTASKDQPVLTLRRINLTMDNVSIT